jgi:hypothetical protein
MMFSQPQHMGVGQFSAHPVAGEGYVHKLSIPNPQKTVNNWFCSHLFHGLLKFQEHVGMLAIFRGGLDQIERIVMPMVQGKGAFSKRFNFFTKKPYCCTHEFLY